MSIHIANNIHPMRDSPTLSTEAGDNGAAAPSDVHATEPNRGGPDADAVYWEMPSREARYAAVTDLRRCLRQYRLCSPVPRHFPGCLLTL